MTTATAPAAPDATAAPAAPATAAAPSTADLVAELAALDAKAAAPVEPAKEAPAEGEPEPAAEPAEPEPEDDDEKGDEAEEEAETEDEPAAPSGNADIDKRVAAVQKQAKREREHSARLHQESQRQLDGQKAEFERAWRPKVEQAERVQALLDKAKADPLALSDELGWDPDTQLYVAQQLYAEAQAKKGDPKYRDQAQRVRREREASGKTGELEKKVADLTTRLEQQDADRRVEAAATRAAAAVGEKTPLLRHMLATNPEHARERIRQATAYFRQQTGAEPSPADVITKLEEVERQELIARGIDPLAAITAAPTKNKTKTAGETKTVKAIAPAPPTKPAPSVSKPADLVPTTEQLVRELEELDRKRATAATG